MQGLIWRFAVARIRSAGSFLKAEGEAEGGGRAAAYSRNTLKVPGFELSTHQKSCKKAVQITCTLRLLTKYTDDPKCQSSTQKFKASDIGKLQGQGI
jgi:hypothetical protein